MSTAHRPSEHVADEAAALVDELWRAMGRSDSEPSDAAGPAAPGENEETPRRLRAWYRAADSFDPAAVERLADVVESASVGLRAFATHLATLRAGEKPSAGAQSRPCACKDSESGGGAQG